MLSRRLARYLPLALLFVALGAAGLVYVLSSPRPATEPPRKGAPAAEQVLGGSSRVVYVTSYRRCRHSDAREGAPGELAGLDATALAGRYPGWSIQRFSGSGAVLAREVDAFCPEHAEYRLIGVSGGRVAVYYGRPGRKPILKELTDISTGDLLPSDATRLEKGIVVRGDARVQRYLEGIAD